MLHDMFGTFGGWLMFVIGVFLSGWVMSLLGRAKGKVSGS